MTGPLQRELRLQPDVPDSRSAMSFWTAQQLREPLADLGRRLRLLRE